VLGGTRLYALVESDVLHMASWKCRGGRTKIPAPGGGGGQDWLCCPQSTPNSEGAGEVQGRWYGALGQLHCGNPGGRYVGYGGAPRSPPGCGHAGDSPTCTC